MVTVSITSLLFGAALLAIGGFLAGAYAHKSTVQDLIEMQAARTSWNDHMLYANALMWGQLVGRPHEWAPFLPAEWRAPSVHRPPEGDLIALAPPPPDSVS